MAISKGGYFGKILDIDLTDSTFKVRELDDATARKYMGGSGLGAYLMYTEIPKGADPLGPDNKLIMVAGPLNGTECPGTRASVSFKSPMTGISGNTLVGGAWGIELKWAGWDAILFRGKAPSPVYVYIVDDKIEFHDATQFWGTDTHTGAELIREELDDLDAKELIIGPAGENLAPLACIISERSRAAGRCGGGAVMGSKNLKGVFVRGTKSVPVADVDKFHSEADRILKVAVQGGPAADYWFKQYGSAANLDQNVFFVGCSVTRNFQTTWFPDITRIGGEEGARLFWQRHLSCMSCPIHCVKTGVIRNHPRFEGLIAEGPEHESGIMVGSNLLISDLGEEIALIEICDAMGIDNVGGGNVVGYTMELFERGILKPEDIDGIEARFGSVDAALALFDAIAHKKGKAGVLLAGGTGPMSKKLGPEAQYYAIQVKGQGVAAWDPRPKTQQGRIHAYIVGHRSGHHHDGTSPLNLLEIIMHSCACFCSRPINAIGAAFRPKNRFEVALEMINPLCGWDMTLEEYQTVGKRVFTLYRAFSHREGKITRKDDILPDRLVDVPLTEGPASGDFITRDMVKKAQDDTYAYFGWDADGIPTEESLKGYGLDFCLADMRS